MTLESSPPMASSRAAHRRGTTSTTLSPHPKPALSLEEWEARAPLGDLEIKSVNALKLAGEKVPLPLKVRLAYRSVANSYLIHF